MMTLWFRRIIGFLSCAFFDALSFYPPLSFMFYGATYYGLIEVIGQDIAELPAGATFFSKGMFGLKIARKRFK